MKKFKKIVTLLAIAVMFSVLTACGSSGNVKNTIKYSDSKIKEYYSRFTTDSATFKGEIYDIDPQDGEITSGTEYYTTNGTNYYAEIKMTATAEDGISLDTLTKSWGIGSKTYYNVSTEVGGQGFYENDILIDFGSEIAYHKIDEPDEVEIKNGEVKVLGETALPEGLGDSGTYYSEQIELNSGETTTFYFSNGELKYIHIENCWVLGGETPASQNGEVLIKIESYTATCDEDKLVIPSNYTIMTYEEYLKLFTSDIQ